MYEYSGVAKSTTQFIECVAALVATLLAVPEDLIKSQYAKHFNPMVAQQDFRTHRAELGVMSRSQVESKENKKLGKHGSQEY